ncbi:MAG: carboxypeptidase regulatory-like domain-containing protein [Chthoniobacterales bacterium]
MKSLLFLSLLCSCLAASEGIAAGNEKNSVEVTLKDMHGKPAAGVQVWLERRQTKTGTKQLVTDNAGRAAFPNVAPGDYKISAYDNRIPAAAATIVKASGVGVTSVTLSLGKMVRAGGSVKKAKHYVWVSEETGTHIGGGRWVAVEDDVNGTGSNPVEKRDGQMFTQPQSQQLRPFTGPSN